MEHATFLIGLSMGLFIIYLVADRADIVCANGGHILEFGFGMGISAGLIQEKDIESHTIIEINDAIYDNLVAFIYHLVAFIYHLISFLYNLYTF